MVDLRVKILELIKRGESIIENADPLPKGFAFPYVSGPEYELWMSEINILNERSLKAHPLYQAIHSNCFHKTKKLSDAEAMVGYLKAVYQDEEFFGTSNPDDNMPLSLSGKDKNNNPDTNTNHNNGVISVNNKVFIVHGHDELAKITVARSLETMGFEAVILHEQADEGKTIIEKIEKYSDVSYAVVLYTECDVGRDKTMGESMNKYRARQNVVFEHGYLIGKLGRDRVCALVKGDIETPGDISGVVYTPMDDKKAWEISLYRNMKAIGLPVDLNRLC